MSSNKLLDLAPGQEDLAPFFDDIEKLFADSDKVLYRARNLIKVVDYQGQPLVVKAFREPDVLRKPIYSYFRKSKAARSLRNSLELLRRGIAVPRPIGCLLYKKNGLLKNSYFVSHLVHYSFDVKELLFGSIKKQRHDLLQKLGRYTLHLHEAEVLHQDYSSGNILIDTKSEETNFFLVDLNRMRFGPLNLHQRMRNFAKLWASDADLRVIVQAYADAAGIDAEQAVALALRYSRQHKKKALLSEKFKRFFRGH